MPEFRKPHIPPEELTTEAHSDDIAESWSKTVRTDFWQPEFFRFKSKLKGKRVLEVGIGSGGDTTLFQKYGLLPGYVGIDISRNMLRAAKNRVLGVSLARMNMYALAFPDNTFDGIWAPTFLYHISKANMGVVLSEIKRVMKPKAVGFLGLVQGEGEGLTTGHYDSSPLQGYQALWKNREFTKVLEKEGFNILEHSKLQGQNMLLYLVSHM